MGEEPSPARCSPKLLPYSAYQRSWPADMFFWPATLTSDADPLRAQALVAKRLYKRGGPA